MYKCEYIYIYIVNLLEKNCFVRCLLAFLKQLLNCQVSIWTATTATTGEPRLKWFRRQNELQTSHWIEGSGFRTQENLGNNALKLPWFLLLPVLKALHWRTSSSRCSGTAGPQCQRHSLLNRTFRLGCQIFLHQGRFPGRNSWVLVTWALNFTKRHKFEAALFVVLPLPLRKWRRWKAEVP